MLKRETHHPPSHNEYLRLKHIVCMLKMKYKLQNKNLILSKSTLKPTFLYTYFLPICNKFKVLNVKLNHFIILFFFCYRKISVNPYHKSRVTFSYTQKTKKTRWKFDKLYHLKYSRYISFVWLIFRLSRTKKRIFHFND